MMLTNVACQIDLPTLRGGQPSHARFEATSPEFPRSPAGGWEDCALAGTAHTSVRAIARSVRCIVGAVDRGGLLRRRCNCPAASISGGNARWRADVLPNIATRSQPTGIWRPPDRGRCRVVAVAADTKVRIDANGRPVTSRNGDLHDYYDSVHLAVDRSGNRDRQLRSI